jgi:tetratricopeptide (TPR) repeat protein
VGLFDWASVASDRLGVAFGVQDGKVLVRAIMPTSPADEDGRLRPGDEILAASPDGQGEMIDAASKPLDEFSAVMRGPIGQPIRLKVRAKEDGKEQIVELTRGKARVWLEEAVELAVTDPALKQVQRLCNERDYAKLAETLRDFDPAAQSPAVLDMQLELLTAADAPSDLVLSFCRRCQIAHPSDYWLNFRMGMLVASTGPAESLRFMQAAMAARPQDANVVSWIGDALVRSGRHTDAEVYFRRGLGLAPKATWLRFNLATTLERLGRTDEAIAELEKVVQEEPDYPPGHGELGRLLAKQGRVEKAMVELRQAVGQAFSYPSSYVNLGICLFNSGQRDEALEMFRRAYEGDGSNAYAYFNLGAALQRLGQLEPARTAFARGLELSPQFIRNRLHLGNSRYLRSLLDDQSLSIIAELERQSPAGHLLAAEGQRLLGSGEPDAAVAKLREAVALNPGHGPTRRSLGEALAVTGDEAGAIEQLVEAVKADPTDIWNHRHLLQYSALVEKLDQYRPSRAAMLTQFANSADPIVLERTAKACLLLADDHKDVRTAAEWAARSVEMAGESHWAITYLYVCRSLGEYRLGQYEAAAKSARKALSFQFNNWRMQIPANLLLAMADHRLGKTSDARRRLIEATRMYRSPSLANEVDQDLWICECLMREAATTILLSGEGGAEISALAALELVALGTGASAKRQYAHAAAYFERAFAAADSHELDLPIIWFYGALAAANASQGRGIDGAELTDAQKSEHLLRAQRWLSNYIEARNRTPAPNRAWEREALGLRMSSAALATFRDEGALAKQTPEQRETSQRTWADLQALLARLGG